VHLLKQAPITFQKTVSIDFFNIILISIKMAYTIILIIKNNCNIFLISQSFSLTDNILTHFATLSTYSTPHDPIIITLNIVY